MHLHEAIFFSLGRRYENEMKIYENVGETLSLKINPTPCLFYSTFQNIYKIKIKLSIVF